MEDDFNLLLAEQSKHQKVQDGYVIAKRFKPWLSKGDQEWDEAAEARAEIRRLQKVIDIEVKKIKRHNIDNELFGWEKTDSLDLTNS